MAKYRECDFVKFTGDSDSLLIGFQIDKSKGMPIADIRFGINQFGYCNSMHTT
jgi:hypothetical protein